MAEFVVKARRLPHGAGLALPAYASAGAAGLDLIAAFGEDERLVLGPGDRALVPTGLTLELPPDCEAQIRPRSGLALKHGVTVLNSPGTIDADYRGEIKVLLINLGQGPFTIQRGDRIAQMVVAKIARVAITETENALETTPRGAGGFGSTGLADRKPSAK